MRKTISTLMLLLAFWPLLAQITHEAISTGIRILPNSGLDANTRVTPDGVYLDQECNTLPISEQEAIKLPWYSNENYLDNFYDSLQTAQSPCSTCRVPGDVEDVWLRVPIRFYVYRVNENTPGGTGRRLPNERDFQTMLDDLNAAFRNNGIKIRFYMKCVNFINTNNVSPLSFVQQTFVASNRDNSAVTVHITDLAGNHYNSVADIIFLTRDVYLGVGGFKTFTHEIGHYFGLEHTHWGNNAVCLREPVSRGHRPRAFCIQATALNTCRVTGDFLCDTPADPNLSATRRPNQVDLDVNNDGVEGDCAYSGNERDHWGDSYNPDVFNYMAYGNRPCRTHFSNQQMKVIKYTAFRRRLSLFNAFRPSTANAFDRFEPDNTDRTARTLVLNAAQTHSFQSANCADMEDWLHFQVPPGSFTGSYYISTIGSGGTSNPIANIEMFTVATGTVNIGFTTGARIAVPFSNANGKARLEIPCQSVTPGQWYLVRLSNNGTQYGQYDVTLTNEPATGQAALPDISGPDLVCGNSVSFTLNNAPASTTITWSASENLTPRSGTGTAATVSAVTGTSGSGSITFSIAGGCNVQITKTVSVNLFEANLTVSPSLDGLCPYDQVQVSVAVTGGASNYVWDVQGNLSIASSQGTNTVYVNATDGFQYGVVRVTFTNSCGQTQNASRSFGRSSACPMEFQYTLYPNPASHQLEVAPDETVTNNKAKDKDFEVEIYDNFAQKRLSAKTKPEDKVKKLTLDVTGLPVGIYVIHIIHQEGIVQKSLDILR